MEHLGLTEDQADKLRQFTEVTDVKDLEVAVGTLASLEWNVEQAIEAHLLQESMMDDSNDEPHIIEDPHEVPPPAARPVPSRSMPTRQNRAETSIATGRTRRRGRPEEAVDDQLHDDEAPPPPAENNESSSSSTSTSTRRTGGSRRAVGAPPSTRMTTRQMSYFANLGATSSSSSSQRAASNASTAPSRNTRSSGRQNGNAAVVIDSDDDDDMRVEYFDEEERELREDLSRVYRPRNGETALIPENPTIPEAMRNFATIFQKKYCGTPATSAFMPQFHQGSLTQAMADAFDSPEISDRRPLALYIHNEKSIAVNIFASQVLCTERVSSLLRHQFIFWPWDVTIESNLLRLLDWMQYMNCSNARSLIQKMAISKIEDFPLILTFVRRKGAYELAEYCTGGERDDQVMERLMLTMETYDEIRRVEAQEKRERDERQQIRSQQEAEYAASLEADRARFEEKRRKDDEKKAAIERKKKAAEDEALRRQTVASMLPDEPSETETDIVQVKFRYPVGAQDMRRFRKKETIQILIDYCSSKGYAQEKFKFFNSDFPKKEITANFDLSKTFEEVNWPGREQVFVEEI